MNERTPPERGSTRRPGGTQKQVSETGRIVSEDEHDLRWELRCRLHAVLQELDVRPVNWDVVKTILEGAVESIEAAT